MNFSIDKDKLQKLLIEHQKVVPLRTTLPVLSCALLKIKNKTLTIKTTDLEQTIISTNTIKDEKEGSICVPMSRFCEIVSALPNEEIKIKSNEDFLIEINSNQGVYKITGRDTKEFPETGEENKKQTLKLSGKDFLNIIEKTGYATSKDDLKPALSGVYIKIKENKITSVATDGHRLVKYIQKTETSLDIALTIPYKFLKIIKSNIIPEKKLEIKVDENSLSTTQNDFTITTRIIKESFPDFNSAIPDNNKIKAEIDVSILISCLKRVSIFSNRTTKQTLLSFTKNGVVVSAQDPENSTSAKEHIDCLYEGEDLTVSYNAKYLTEALQYNGTSTVNIFLSTALTAAILQPKEKKENEEITTLLMPLRINA